MAMKRNARFLGSEELCRLLAQGEKQTVRAWILNSLNRLALLVATFHAIASSGADFVVCPVGATSSGMDEWTLPMAYDGAGLLNAGASSVETGDAVPAVWPAHDDMDHWSSGVSDVPVWIRFDLGKEYPVKGMRLWNLNTSWGTGSGIKNATVSVSTDGKTYTSVALQGLDGSGRFYRAPGAATGYTGESYTFSGVARYIRFSISSDWDDMIAFTGVGLSEVRFIAGAAAPVTASVAGAVLDVAGVAVPGVCMATNGGVQVATTGADGAYSAALPEGFSGTLTATKSGCVFLPAMINVVDVRAPVEANFRAVADGIEPTLWLASNTCSWVGIGGVVYQPQASYDLIEWQNLSEPVEGADTVAHFAFSRAGTNSMFFKLQAESLCAPTLRAMSGVAGQQFSNVVDGVTLTLPEGISGTLGVANVPGIVTSMMPLGQGFSLSPDESGRILIQIEKRQGLEPGLFLWQEPLGFVDGFAAGHMAWLPLAPVASNATHVTYEIGSADNSNSVSSVAASSAAASSLAPPIALRPIPEHERKLYLCIQRLDEIQRQEQQRIEALLNAKLNALLARLSEPMRNYALTQINGAMKPRVLISVFDPSTRIINDTLFPNSQSSAFYSGTQNPLFCFNPTAVADHDLVHELGHYLTHLFFPSFDRFLELKDTAPQNHGLGEPAEPRVTVIEEYAYFVEHVMGTKGLGNGNYVTLNMVHSDKTPFPVEERNPWSHDYPSFEGFGANLMASLVGHSRYNFEKAKVDCLVDINLPVEKVFALFASGALNINELRIAICDLLTPGEQTRFQVIAEQMGWSYRSQGVITDPSGDPVSNVLVTCYVATDQGDIEISHAHSQTNGVFTLKRTAPGQVKLKAVREDDSKVVWATRSVAWEAPTPTLWNLGGLVVPGHVTQTVTVATARRMASYVAPNGTTGRAFYSIGYSINSSLGLRAMGGDAYEVPTGAVVNVSFFGGSGSFTFSGPLEAVPDNSMWLPDPGSNDEGYQYVDAGGGLIDYTVTSGGQRIGDSVTFANVQSAQTVTVQPLGHLFGEYYYLDETGGIMPSTIGLQWIPFDGLSIHVTLQ
jgi:hypothetical protein